MRPCDRARIACSAPPAPALCLRTPPLPPCAARVPLRCVGPTGAHVACLHRRGVAVRGVRGLKLVVCVAYGSLPIARTGMMRSRVLKARGERGPAAASICSAACPACLRNGAQQLKRQQRRGAQEAQSAATSTTFFQQCSEESSPAWSNGWRVQRTGTRAGGESAGSSTGSTAHSAIGLDG